VCDGSGAADIQFAVASARGTLYVDGRPKSRGQVTTAGDAGPTICSSGSARRTSSRRMNWTPSLAVIP